MAYEIIYSPEAVDHLTSLATHEVVSAVDQVEQQLTHEPKMATRRRKVLRPNPLAPWVLRLGNVRVFYEVVETPAQQVIITAVGKKVHNELWIGGERIEL